MSSGSEMHPPSGHGGRSRRHRAADAPLRVRRWLLLTRCRGSHGSLVVVSESRLWGKCDAAMSTHLSTMSGYRSSSPKPALGAWSAESARSRFAIAMTVARSRPVTSAEISMDVAAERKRLRRTLRSRGRPALRTPPFGRARRSPGNRPGIDVSAYAQRFRTCGR